VEIDDRDTLAVNDGLTSGRYLNLMVGDTGVGIDPAILERIFDPFFTTKKPGDGTGYGSCRFHGIVKDYQGAIIVKSDVE